MARRVHQRSVRPGAVWLWALLMAVCALKTDNPLILGVELAVIGLVVADRSPLGGRWRSTFSAVVMFALAATIARFVIVCIIPPPAVAPLAWNAPSWEPIAGFRIGGAVSWATLVAGVYDSLRLLVTVAAFGAAGSISTPSDALRSMPSAVYEIGVATAVGLSVAPLGADTVRRHVKMRRMRGRSNKGISGWLSLASPVLDETLDRALGLAASLDSRGYGVGQTYGSNTRANRVLTWLGLALLGLGTYRVGTGSGAVSSLTGPVASWGLIAAATAIVVVATRRRSDAQGHRTRYVTQSERRAAAASETLSKSGRRHNAIRWRRDEWQFVGGALACVVATLIQLDVAPRSMDMTIDTLRIPQLPVIATLGALLAAAPALLPISSIAQPPLVENAPTIDPTRSQRWKVS